VEFSATKEESCFEAILEFLRTTPNDDKFHDFSLVASDRRLTALFNPRFERFLVKKFPNLGPDAKYLHYLTKRILHTTSLLLWSSGSMEDQINSHLHKCYIENPEKIDRNSFFEGKVAETRNAITLAIKVQFMSSSLLSTLNIQSFLHQVIVCLEEWPCGR
jgi:hypothetical protein